MTIITRFAPSPTGYLHIGGARTALYNWLYAKANGGKFLLRIEDTDRERSTQPAIDAILRSMRWLGMDWDGEEIYQFARASRHAEVAEQLVKDGKAYYCYTSPEELTAFRAANPHAKYRSPWREGGTPPADIKPVIRLKAPIKGETIVYDGVKGTVSVQNAEMDDMVLLRSDGTPTYMLAVVVDDHDMNVTHVIRGDDHFTNTFRQIQLYDACGWSKPHFSHVPMILGSDGAKLSKRHGALGVEEYQKMGFLPEALNNYLLRLGWSHGDDEIISQQQAIEWFNLEHISNSPARFDMEKLKSVNAHYMHLANKERKLLELVKPFLKIGVLNDENMPILERAMPHFGERGSSTLMELADDLHPLLVRPQNVSLDDSWKPHLRILIERLESEAEWSNTNIHNVIGSYMEKNSLKAGTTFMALREALTGNKKGASVVEIMFALGKDETIARLKAVL